MLTSRHLLTNEALIVLLFDETQFLSGLFCFLPLPATEGLMTDGWKSGGTWRDLTPTTYRVIAAWQQIAMAATFVAIKCSGPGFPLMVLQI